MRILWCSLLWVGCTRISDDELAWRQGVDGAVEPDTDGLPDTGDCGEEGSIWSDQDGDGYGDPSLPEDPCAPSETAVDNDLDCDDSNPDIHPDALESCATDEDDNCDGSNNAVDAEGCNAFYLDEDGDGYGIETDSQCVCEPWEAYSAELVGDCDDASGDVNPGAEEICNNGVDEDCDTGPSDCERTGDLDVSGADLRVLADNAGDLLGTSVAGVGDIDGDGLDDWMVGAPAADLGGSAAGQVYLISGSQTGAIDLGTDSQIVIHGGSAGDYFGWSVAGLGDLDGDGYGDLLLGARLDSSEAYRAGAAYVVFGPYDGESNVTDIGVRYTGESEEDFAGGAVASAGDIDGDGEIDILIGAYQESTGGSAAGAAYLVLGPHEASGSLSSGIKITGVNAENRVGYSVAGLGDTNGDGLDDFAVGADREDGGINNSGAVYLFSEELSTDVTVSDATAVYRGVESSQNAGADIAGAGDINGDGYQDLLIGGPGQNSSVGFAGAAWVVFGPHEGTHSLDDADVQITGVQAADRFGFSVSAAGDVDGDGSPDVWVGAKSMSRDGGAPQGAGVLFYGPLNGTLLAEEAGLMVWGDETNETWGSVDVAGVGDVNGDSRPDLVLGTSSSSDSGSLSGSATLIWGGGL